MKLSTSTIFQALTWITTAGASYEHLIPARFQPYALAVVGVASVLLHLYAGVHDTTGNILPPVSK